MTLPTNSRLAGAAYLLYLATGIGSLTAPPQILVVQLLVQQAAGASTNWSSPIRWAIWFPLLIFELAFAAVLLANRLRTVTAT